MKAIQIESTVERVVGNAQKIGGRGVVVALDAERGRAQVQWRDRLTGSDKPMTWLALSRLVAISEPVQYGEWVTLPDGSRWRECWRPVTGDKWTERSK